MSLRNRIDRVGSRLFGRAARPDAPPPRSLDEVRAAYVERRRGQLSCHVDPSSTRGIEIGGFDVPTVPSGLGDCVLADSRTEHELNRLFDVPVDRILPVDYVIEPRVALSLQIEERFDYAVLCHVLEHVPNLIDFLHQVATLLVPNGIVFVALPDKRHTDDSARASTTTARLIERHLDGVTRPSVAEVADFALAWNAELKRLYADSPQEFYRLVVEQARFAHPDVHCNVWRDDEFFLQARELILLGYLPELEIVQTLPTPPRSNEFYVVMRRRAAEGEAKPSPARATRRVHYRSCNFCGGGHFDVFKRIHAPFPERLYADSRPDPELGALLSLQYLTCRHCGLSAINPLPDFDVVDRPRFDAGGVLESMAPGPLDAFIGQGEQEMEILCRQYDLDSRAEPAASSRSAAGRASRSAGGATSRDGRSSASKRRRTSSTSRPAASGCLS